MPLNAFEDVEEEYYEDEEHGISFAQRKLKFHNSKTFNDNRSVRFLSYEVEIAGCNKFEEIDSVCSNWSSSVVADGSLPDGGFEINTAPTNGDEFIVHMDELCKALKKGGSYVDRSTGCHLHIDGRDYDYFDKVKLLKLYAHIEDGLFSLVPDSRRRNSYCMKCGDSYLQQIKQIESTFAGSTKKIDYEEIFAKAVYKKDKSILKAHHGKNPTCGSRYLAMNVHSLVYRGTVECRLHPGTTDFQKLVNWGMLWCSILDFAKQNNSIDDLPSNSFEALLAITPNKECYQWCVKRYEKLK